MNYKEITGSLSKPSKMPGHAYGLPAQECKTGSKLAKVKGSTCNSCYALKGCYVFKVVKAAQYKRLESIRDIRAGLKQWQLRSTQKEINFLDGMIPETSRTSTHLSKIFAVCSRITPDTAHWMPTREAWVKKYMNLAPA